MKLGLMTVFIITSMAGCAGAIPVQPSMNNSRLQSWMVTEEYKHCAWKMEEARDACDPITWPNTLSKASQHPDCECKEFYNREPECHTKVVIKCDVPETPTSEQE